MSKDLFLHIVDAMSSYDLWFLKRPDALDRLGLSTLQKCVAAMRMFAYGVPIDACDDYYRLDE